MRGFRLAKIAGFEINIDWSWLIILFLVTYSLARYYFPEANPGMSVQTNWLMGFVAAILLFVSVLAHEMMHSVVARRYGIEIKGITLFIFGGVSQTGEEPNTPGVEFYMAIAGPATSLILGGIFYLLTVVGGANHWPVPLVAITGYLGLINIVLAIFNMVPGFPLDGGRVLRSGLWAWTRSLERSTRYASYAGQAVGYLLIGFGIFNILAGAFIGGIWMIFIGWFLAGAAKSSYEQVVFREALSGVDVERVMTAEVPTVVPETSVEDFVNNYLMRQEFTCYPVAEGDHVLGVVSIDEVRALPRDQWAYTPVREITVPVDSEMRIDKEDNAWDALMKLTSEDRRRLLVMHNGTLDGTVTQENILRLVRTRLQLGV